MADESRMLRDAMRQLETSISANNGHAPGAAPNAQQSQEQAIAKAVLSSLEQLGGNRMQEDALLFEGDKFILPQQYGGKVEQAIDFLQQHIKQEAKVHAIVRTFNYRPNDVAFAVKSVMKQLFGTTGLGKDMMTMFGPTPPVFKTIDIAFGKTDQVPQDLVTLPAIEGTIHVGGTGGPLGNVGAVSVECPRKYRGVVEGLFKAIENHLRDHSIYRGQAITGSGEPTFLDTSTVDPAKVVYSDQILQELDVHLWTPIRQSALFRKLGQPLKRAVLLHGPYGTGKSLAGYLTAQIAPRHGWTFIFVKPTDNLERAMQTAQLYAPAVVFFEDIDVVADSSNPERTSKLLDAADGITGKGKEVIVVMTTNHPDKIHKGMLRPGRMDAVIRIGELDAHGIEKLAVNTLPGAILADDIDWALVATAVQGYMPAFVAEAIGRAFKYALARTGDSDFVLATDDFVNAANGLREHFQLMTGAHEGHTRPTLDLAFREVVKEVAEASRGYDYENDELETVHGNHHVVVEDEPVHPQA
jgi:transitional endoplasmic reticulum ATPase